MDLTCLHPHLYPSAGNNTCPRRFPIPSVSMRPATATPNPNQYVTCSTPSLPQRRQCDFPPNPPQTPALVFKHNKLFPGSHLVHFASEAPLAHPKFPPSLESAEMGGVSEARIKQTVAFQCSITLPLRPYMVSHLR